jgi:hypothetical protein
MSISAVVPSIDSIVTISLTELPTSRPASVSLVVSTVYDQFPSALILKVPKSSTTSVCATTASSSKFGSMTMTDALKGAVSGAVFCIVPLIGPFTILAVTSNVGRTTVVDAPTPSVKPASSVYLAETEITEPSSAAVIV